MMKKIILILIQLIFLAAGCNSLPEKSPGDEMSIETAQGEAGEKVLIRLKPGVGDTQNMTVTLSLKSADEQDEMNVSMISKMDVSVVKKEDSVYTYEMRYKAVKMNIQAGAMEMEFDSDSKEENSMGSILGSQMRGLLDKPVFMKMDQMGRVLEFHLPGNLTKDQTGDLSSISIPLPEQPVGTGDSWTAKKPVEGFGEMEMTMTVEKITVDFVQIKVTGFINKKESEDPGEFDGTYKLDRKTGFTRDGVMNMELAAGGKKMQTKIEFKSI